MKAVEGTEIEFDADLDFRFDDFRCGAVAPGVDSTFEPTLLSAVILWWAEADESEAAASGRAYGFPAVAIVDEERDEPLVFGVILSHEN